MADGYRMNWSRRVLHGGPLGLLVLGVAVVAACQPRGGSEAASQGAQAVDLTPTVVLETSVGRIVMELDRERAPVSVSNFLTHVRSQFYDGLVFHRVVAGFVIQAGLVTERRAKRRSPVSPIMNEADNGLRNVRGAVGMARMDYPNSATSEFFINVVDNTAKLDHRAPDSWEAWGYAVFGQVMEGMEVVDAIAALPTRPQGEFREMPVEPVVIRRAYLLTEETPE